MRLVLDTNVVVAGMRSPGEASAELIRRARRGRATLVSTVALALEYEAVCRREEHRRAAALSAAETELFLNAIVALVETVETWFLWRPQLRDPADELVLEAGVNGRADAIVTFNRQDFAPEASRFGVEVLLPREALLRTPE